jgi:hypothetical protein
LGLGQTVNVRTGNGNLTSGDELESDILTVFAHSNTARYWISGQANVILQWHPSFRAKYSGPNSLTAPAQSATTHILTLYTGYELTHTTEVFASMARRVRLSRRAAYQ